MNQEHKKKIVWNEQLTDWQENGINKMFIKINSLQF